MESLKVRDYMNSRPVTFKPGESITEAVDKLLAGNVTGAPVIDETGCLVGFLSEQDCLGTAIEASYHCETVALVSELMRKDVLSVKPDDSVFELAQTMRGLKPKVYPVLDDDKQLIGVITRKEVLRALAKQMKACFR